MNKTKFIRLHNSDNNTVVVVNVERIAVIDTDEVDKRIVSTIYMDTTSSIKEFHVNETAEKIYSIIEEMNKDN